MATIKWSLFVGIYTLAAFRYWNLPTSTPQQESQYCSKHIVYKNPACRPVYSKMSSQWGDKVLYCALSESVISPREPANNLAAGYTDKNGKRGDMSKAQK